MNKNVSKFLIIFIIAAVAFTSCQKEEAITESKTNDPVLERILDFKKDVENPNYKSGEYIDVEDAVWLVEAALNYSYCVLEEETILENNQKDSISFDINLNNNKLLFNDVRNIYLQLNQYTEQLNVDNKTYLIDIFFKDNKIEARILFGEENMQKSTTWNGFTEPCHFMLADGLIENAVNNHIIFTTPFGFFTDVETTVEKEPGMCSYLRNPESNDQNYCYYYIFEEGSGYFDPNGTWSTILTVEEMNFYYDGAFIGNVYGAVNISR